ncbi:unnamed protein product [Caenorhabditis brenneri]
MSISMPLLTFIQPSMLTAEQYYLEEWTNSSRFLFYSVIGVAFFTLPILFCSLCWTICRKNRGNVHFLPYLCAVLVGNMVLLGTLLASVLTENTDVIYEKIPGLLVCKVTAFLVNSSSCFIHWSWVAMYAERFCYIFFPLRFRTHNPCRTRGIILFILIMSMCIQLWTPIFITGRRLDKEFDNIYCGEDPMYASSHHTQLIVILEVFTTFFLPLILTIFADISVLTWKKAWGESIHLVSQDELWSKNIDNGNGDAGSRKHSHMKIVSSNSMRNSQKRRYNAIRRCLISASITLFLNLPNYLLQVFDEFYNLKDNESMQIRRTYLRMDACFYVMYLMQFPLTPFHIFTLTRRTKSSKESRQSQQHSAPNSIRITDNHHTNGIVNHV